MTEFFFTVTKPETANYTPASLIYEYAKAGKAECFTGFWGENFLIVNGEAFTYSHWKITPRQDRPGLDEVKVYMSPRGSLLRLEHEESARRANR